MDLKVLRTEVGLGTAPCVFGGEKRIRKLFFAKVAIFVACHI
jgi:hypothetical protein